MRRLSRLAASAGMFLVMPLMLLTTGDVISRSFFNKPVAGTLELSEYLLVVFVLLGAAYTQQVKGHVGVDFLTSRFSPQSRSFCQVLTTLASLFIVTVLVWQGFLEGLHERTVSDMWRIPQSPFRLLVAAGGLLLWLELFIDFLESLARLMGRQG